MERFILTLLPANHQCSVQGFAGNCQAIRLWHDQIHAVDLICLSQNQTFQQPAHDDQVRYPGWFQLNEQTGLITIRQGLTSDAPIYFKRVGATVFLSDYLPLLVDAHTPLDESAVFSLLQYGVVLAPRTLFQQTKRLERGFDHLFKPMGGWQHMRNNRLGSFDRTETRVSTNDESAILNDIERTIDHDLQLMIDDKSPAILFSGGVDSSLLAARAKKLGWDDTLLIHYSFGEDEHTQVARNVARQLNLQMMEIADDPDQYESVFDHAGMYPQPFGDHSTLPSFLIGQRLLAEQPSLHHVVDGIGADTVYGAVEKFAMWKRLYACPRAVTQLGSSLHHAYWYRPSRVEHMSRLARRVQKSPITLGPWLAQNALAGILYDAERASQDAVHRDYNRWMLELAENASVDQQMLITLLSPHCTDLYTQKLDPVLSQSRYHPVHPFLSEASVELALTRAPNWPTQSQRKERLKKLLAQQISPELVYRPKQGFVPPFKRLINRPSTLARLNQLRSTDSPLAPWLNRRVITQLVDRIRRDEKLASPVEYFIWNVLFTTAWIEQRPTIALSTTPTQAGFIPAYAKHQMRHAA